MTNPAEVAEIYIAAWNETDPQARHNIIADTWTPDAVYVIEVSSYQLDLTTTFAPDVAILTNISPDHLDRHGGMAGYVAAMARS